MATQTATILVSDMVGSTELRVALGEERAEQVRRAHDRVLVDAVEQAGGTIVKGLGDGFLVLFPGAAQALTTAVVMQQSIHTLARRERLDLAIRIGISSGDVTVEGGDCFGLPVVEASRLCAVGEPGAILVADIVTSLLRGRAMVPLEHVGPIDLKGIPDPVVVYRARWTPVRGMADLRGPVPYVGRDAERSLIRELFDRAATGAGGLVLIAGEPGIGKTRLVTELCRDLESDDAATVLVGGCHDGEVHAFAPFVTALTEWVRSTPRAAVEAAIADDGAHLGRFVPHLREVLPHLAEPADLDPDEAQSRLHDAVGSVLTRLGDDRPVVLVLDDLHWADTATIALLRAVARRATHARVLVAGTYRDTDLERRHPLAEALPLLRREVDYTRVALHGLQLDAVQSMLEQLAEHDVPEAFTQRLLDQTEGNPFFLREMLIHLVEVGALRVEDDQWVAAEHIESAIPEGIREVVGQRISQLSAPAQQLLTTGALFEVEFPLAVAAEVAGLDEESALDAIDEALAAQVLLATETFDHYRFSHALFRQTLRGELNPSRQVRTHRAIAEALDQRVSGRPSPSDAAVLAWHWHRSAALPGAERGVPAWLAVADDAAARFAFHEARDALSAAIELLPDHDERTAELLLRRAVAATRIHDDHEVILADAREGARLTAERGGETADALVALIVASLRSGDSTLGWQVAAIARSHLDPTRRDATWAVIRECELQEAEYADPVHAGLPLDTPARRELLAVMESLPADQLFGFFLPPSRAAARRFIARAPRGLARVIPLFTYGGMRVLPDMDTAIEEADATGYVDRAAVICAMRARVLVVVGRHDDADASLNRAFELLPKVLPTSNAAFQVFAAPAMIGFVQGRHLTGLPLEQLRAMAENPGTRWASLAVTAAAALASAEAGERVQAVALLDDVRVGIELAPGYAPNYVLIICLYCQVLWTLDHTDHAGTIEHHLRTKVLEPEIGYPEVRPELAMAQLCALTGRIQEARQWAAAAHAVIDREQMPPLQLQVYRFEAELELRLGPDGDRDRFDAALTAGRAGCGHPSMAPWLDRFDDLERRAREVWAS